MSKDQEWEYLKFFIKFCFLSNSLWVSNYFISTEKTFVNC